MPSSPSPCRAQNPPRGARRRPLSRRGGGGGGGWQGGGIVSRVSPSGGSKTTSQDSSGSARPAMVMWWRRPATITSRATAGSHRCAVCTRTCALWPPGLRTRNTRAMAHRQRDHGPTGHAHGPAVTGRLVSRAHASGVSPWGGLGSWASTALPVTGGCVPPGRRAPWQVPGGAVTERGSGRGGRAGWRASAMVRVPKACVCGLSAPQDRGAAPGARRR
jgi:hypothetical protein